MSSTTDPIADLLTRIRNAIQAQHRYVDVPLSKMKESIVKVLKEQGFIDHYLVKNENSKGTMRIFLRYTEGRKSVIQGLRRFSMPGLRRYVPSKSVPIVLDGMGISILSTPKGVMIGKDARAHNVGGEVLCLIW